MTLRGVGVVLLLAFAAPGCLVAEPQGYEEPRRTPPILDLYSAKPFIGGVLTVDRSDNIVTNDKIDFKIPVRSDDQGESLYWLLYIDRTFTSLEKVLARAAVPASTLDDTTRYVQHSWRADSTPNRGCHTLSFVVAHRSSWDEAVDPPLLLDTADSAVGTWWVNLDPASLTDPSTLPRCPSRTEFQ